MATTIPENVERFTTEGERQAYHFFKIVAKPAPVLLFGTHLP